MTFRENIEVLASGKFWPGQYVKLWNGHRLGVIAEVHRATVGVRTIGGKQQGFHFGVQCFAADAVTQMEQLPLARLPLLADRVVLKDWPHNRPRQAEVTAVDGILFEAQYELANGIPRRHWFDLQRIIRFV